MAVKNGKKSNNKPGAAFREFQKSRKGKAEESGEETEEITPEKKDENYAQRSTTFLGFKQTNKVKDEILLSITGAISFLLILSYIGLCGPIGKFVNFICFGFMGFFGYVFPFALFAMIYYLISNRKNTMARNKLFVCLSGIICITALIHIFSSGSKLKGPFQAFKQGYKKKSGGGFFGGLISWPLWKIGSKILAVVIIILVLLIVIYLLTGKAIMSIIHQKNKNTYHQIAEKRKARKEDRERERLERNAREGKIAFEKLMEDKPKLYKAEVGPENSYIVERNNRQTSNDSFIERLKNGGVKPGEKVERKSQKTIYSVPVGNDDKKTVPETQTAQAINAETDMVEISGLEEVFADYSEKSVYEQELERKFGKSSGNDIINSEETYPSEIINDREDEPEPIITGNVIKDIPQTSFNHTVQSPKPVSETKVPGLFARGDLRPANSGEIESHSLAGKQNMQSATPLDDGRKAVAVKRVKKENKPYSFPPVSLLAKPQAGAKGTSQSELKETSKKLEDTLRSFGVNVTITNISCGPSVTRYELQPEVGVKVSKITSLTDDIKMNLAATDIRMEAPIPGKSAIGIEVPNKENQIVYFSSLVNSDEFKNSKSKLTFAVGKDIGGQVIVADIAKMPHLLIAGATGSGKSVCINTLIMSIIYKADPNDVKLILVDPKVVELSVYNGLPHLLIPVVTDPKKASGALNWAVMEMTDRYKKFADLGVRDLAGYNKKVEDSNGELKSNNGEIYEKMPQIVFVIDELADLMMVAPGEVEDYIIRLTQLARACGIHLVIATQRPSVNVITGLIKANVPSRIAFAVASQVDSRTILDMGGAEKLLGKGDMLFSPVGLPKPVRVQGAFISDSEVMNIVDYVKAHNSESDTAEMEAKIHSATVEASSAQGKGGSDSGSDNSSDVDELIYKAGMFIIEKEKASIGSLQRQFKIGFNRAARIMDQLSEAGVVGPEEGTKPRQILMDAAAFTNFAQQNGLPM